MKLVVFDLDGTLIKINSTFRFLDFYFKKINPPKYLGYKLLFYSLFFINVLLIKLFHKDLIRRIAFAMFKGEPVSRVEKVAEEFVASLPENDYLEETTNLIKNFKEQYTVVLISSTLDFLLKYFGVKFGVDLFFGSRLAVEENGKFSGEILQDLTGTKMQIVLSNFERWDELIVVTDNFGDKDLIQAADKAYIVSRKHHLKKWEKIVQGKQIQFIEVD